MICVGELRLLELSKELVQGALPAATGQVEHLLTPRHTTAQCCTRSLAVPADLKHEHNMPCL